MEISDFTDKSVHSLTKQLGKKLSAAGKVCAVAESCTGGMIGATLTAIPGSSTWFHGGIIAYDNRVKKKVLGVPENILDKQGAVSAETVTAMAAGAAKLISCEYAVAVSGIAGPGGGTDEKPVGLVYIGIYFQGQTVSFRHMFKGNREAVRKATVITALQHLNAHVS